VGLEYASARYQISGGFSNLSQLPFAPTFDASSIVPGQNVYVSSAAFVSSGPYIAHAMTITLMPQTIDGAILASTMSGGFTLYTVQLASYDLPVDLALQQGQSINVTQPSVVTVYADSTARVLTSSALQVGQTARFYGLLFDDNGVLRMDCAQILDGVAQ
jgi:hypothetical protein